MDCQLKLFCAKLVNAQKWQAVLAMEDRYFHNGLLIYK